MGNIQQILSSMNDNQKIEFLIKEGLLCDEIIQLYRNGTISYPCIEKYVFDNICAKHK
jgi:hypothetical protein